MGWVAVWQLALKQFSAETVEVRLVILLTAAFLFALVLVGLKYAFRPAEAKSSAPAPIPANAKRVFAAPVAAVASVEVQTPKPAAPRPPLKVPQPATRKSVKLTINRQQATRPTIRGVKLPSSAENRISALPRSPKRG